MWIAVETSLMIIMEKCVTFLFHYNYFLCVMHPQILKPFGWEHLFTYRVDIINCSVYG